MRHPQVRVHTSPPGRPGKKALWLGLAGAVISRLSGRSLPAITCDDLKRHDFPMSTQRLGVRFTERIRDIFRFRWIREIF